MLTKFRTPMISANTDRATRRAAIASAALLLALNFMAFPAISHAQVQSEPPRAAIVSSPVSGVVFEDAPRILPIDSRFSQAIQTIAFDVGLTCEQVESYGWTIGANEQDRVNTIFTQTAQELARLGYSVIPQSPGSASADITVFTATRPDKNVLFTWSAGNSGLLLLMCDARSFNNGEVTKRGFGPGAAAATSAARANAQEAAATHEPAELVGEWSGTYSCLGQGPTGGTLTISRVTRDRDGFAVSGTFGFYPLKDKNPEVPRGLYRVRGRYDPVHQRAILEPGAWLQHPADYYNAVMVTEFNLDQKRTSGVFQGTTGCTSFEAAYKDGSADRAAAKALPDEEDTKAVKKVVKPKAKPKAKPVAETAPAVTTPAADATVSDIAPAVAPTVSTGGATGSAIPADSNGGAAEAVTVPAAPVTETAPPLPVTTAQPVAPTPTQIGIPTTTGPGLHDTPAVPDTTATPAAMAPVATVR